MYLVFFFSSRRRHTRLTCDWSSDVCSSDLARIPTCSTLHPGPANHWPGGPSCCCSSASPSKCRACRSTPGCPTHTSKLQRQRSEERRVGKEGRTGGVLARRRKHEHESTLDI